MNTNVMSFVKPPSPPPPNTMPHVTGSVLPLSQLESLRFKANQIIDSIQALQRTIESGHQAVMPAWPDILSKYNILLSQTHSFSTALVQNPALNAGRTSSTTGNPFEKIALHPSTGMSDAQLDGEVIPLLRNQQTLDVLRMENDTVRRIAEHMTTKGSIGVLGGAAPPPRDVTTNKYVYGSGMGAVRGKVEYEDVLRECEEIRSAHDRRVERAVRAVTMLREKYDWKQRVEVEVEEPEELEWDPRMRMHKDGSGGDTGEGGTGDGGEDGDGDIGMESPEGGSSDEDEVEGALVNSSIDIHSPLTNITSLPQSGPAPATATPSAETAMATSSNIGS